MARVLIIDDEMALRQMLRQVLERAGYEVIEARDGREGLQQLPTTTVDVIIADIFIAGQESLATIAALQDQAPAVKIIVMSGSDRIGNRDIAEATRRLGVYSILKKPFELHELLEMVHDALRQ